MLFKVGVTVMVNKIETVDKVHNKLHTEQTCMEKKKVWTMSVKC